ncbi:MAG: 1-acyl-sn-glycerol-3-phosphate acyltransferase [Rhizobiaceae bacterium]|nr:1-acyl-sn-glycerol-3-phosphate acyltransferase [Rhizobiaceae bacterium]
MFGDVVTMKYPRRIIIRFFLRLLAKFAFLVLGKLRITGLENIPKNGPVILVANHFHFADPVAMLVATNRQVEFVGGFRFPNAPAIVKFIPRLWGYFPVFRGAYSRKGLEAAKNVLAQDGVLGIFPEGGAWAQVLRPARPGAAFLGVETGAIIIPIGLVGFTDLFKKWRPELRINIGKPVGPFKTELSGKERRGELDRIGEHIMRQIAELLPHEYHGVFSADAELKNQAQSIASFPFERDDMRGM